MNSQVIVTMRDAMRLRMLSKLPLARGLTEELRALEELLSTARLVSGDEVPRGVITMGSRILIEHTETYDRIELVLVYPWLAEVTPYYVSVTSPLGLRLLGRSLRRTIAFERPGGGVTRWTIVDVPYQPEAAGHES